MTRCPFCLQDIAPGSAHCVGLLGKRGGSVSSPRKAASSRRNGSKRKISNSDAQIAIEAVEVAEQLSNPLESKVEPLPCGHGASLGQSECPICSILNAVKP